jgi:hypothetical protein
MEQKIFCKLVNNGDEQQRILKNLINSTIQPFNFHPATHSSPSTKGLQKVWKVIHQSTSQRVQQTDKGEKKNVNQ